VKNDESDGDTLSIKTLRRQINKKKEIKYILYSDNDDSDVCC